MVAKENLFISWSGDLSKKIAEEFNDWLPLMIHNIKPYFSPEMEKGIPWGAELNKQLSELKLGILIITPDNKESQWIHYEAGGLASKLEQTRVCPLCFNMKATDLTRPLSDLNAAIFSKDEIFKLVNSINNSLDDLKLDSKILNDEFKIKWPILDKVINQVLKEWKPSKSTPKSRSSDEKIDEILSLTRDIRQSVKSRTMRRTKYPTKMYATKILSPDKTYQFLITILEGSVSDKQKFIDEIESHPLIDSVREIIVSGGTQFRVYTIDPDIDEYIKKSAAGFNLEIEVI